MARAAYISPSGSFRSRAGHISRLLRVLAVIDFKTKYTDSILGYVWSVIKPLSYFAVLWIVFARVFRLSGSVSNFALYRIIGIVLSTFTTDGVGSALSSIGRGASIIRRLSFPRIVIPVSATVAALMTFGINLSAVVVFLVAAQVRPEPDWLLLLPLFVELYAFILGLGLLIATLYVRLRDVQQIWELIAQLLVFATPVMYPITILPRWAQIVEYCNPLVQVMQDARALILGSSGQPTISSVMWGEGARIIPISIALGTLAIGLFGFSRDAPRLAELV